MPPVGSKLIAALVAAAAAGAAGCAGNGAGLDANGNPITSGGGPGPLTADFQSIQDNVFTPICSVCHSGGGAPEGLQLDADHSYAMIVGVPSNEQPGLKRVDPGNPDSSYLVLKIQGSPGISGVRMPANGPPYLPQSTIDVIRQWITNGAPKSAPAAASVSASLEQQLRVTVTSPDDGAIASMVLPRIVVAFNSDLDPSLIDRNTVGVERIGLSGPGSALQFSAAIPAGDPSALVISPAAPLENGTYRVTLRSSLADMNARAMGADYSFTFTVDALQ